MDLNPKSYINNIMEGYPTAIIFILVGFFFIGLSLLPVYQDLQTSSWETTEGEVILSEISSGSEPGTQKPNIEYTYSVNGVNYSSNRIHAFGGYSSSGSYARDTVSKYPIGTELTVYYNPEKPSESAIERGQIMSLTYFGVFMGSIAVIAGFWYGYRIKKGKESETKKPFIKPMKNKYLESIIQPKYSRGFGVQSDLLQQQSLKRNGVFENSFLSRKPNFSFNYKEMNIFVGYQEVPMSEDSTRPETTVKVKFQMSNNIKLLIYSKDIKLMMEWMVGIHKMEVDNSNFNNKFVIKTNDKDFSCNLLNHEVQEKLMDLEANSFFPVLKITKDTFSLTSRNSLDNEEEYDKLIDASLFVLDKLRFSGAIKN